MSASAQTPGELPDELVAFSRERIEKGSQSFAVAADLFAPDTRASAYMLYAWCRHCDDVIDGQEGGRRGVALGRTDRMTCVAPALFSAVVTAM